MINKRTFLLLSLIALICFLIKSCIEPFDVNTISYEDILVIEGRLTNEYKQHEVLLSRTSEIDTLSINPEKNAAVYLTDDTSDIIYYSEIEDGKYQSNNAFIAESNKLYTLNIETSSGNKYSSTPQQLTSLSDIGDIDISLQENNIGNTTLDINVNSIGTNQEAQYYYYEYEETSKIIAPYWSPKKFDMTYYPDSITLISKQPPFKEICYKTEYSSGARIQTETISSNNNNVVNFNVKSMSQDDYRITHSYSILIKQYIQTYESYLYHETLNKFSDFSNLFSENQVGFINGNFYNEENIDEKIIGFFAVNSVTSKRIFFNREEYIDTPSDVYPVDCVLLTPILVGPDDPDSEPLLTFYEIGYDYYNENYIVVNPREDGPYLIAPNECGDCTEVGGKIEKPEFWLD